MKTTIYHLLVFSFLPLLCFSRQREKSSVSLRGSVFSAETLLPLKGATVHVKGGNISAISDSDGQFFISLPSGEGTLLISYIGYQNKEISVDSLTGAKSRIYLSIAEASLKEVVISTGYQQIAKQKVTGSYERIGTELFSRTVSTDVLSRLEGIVTGLNVDKRTGNNSISIRGLSTIYASTQPLVVLNDFPYDGDINNINPNDIESISILKDASAASIWGARAGNGVIVISTKKGRFSQKPLIDVNSNISIAEKPDIFALPRISSSDFIDAEMDLFNKGFYTSMESSYDHPVLSPVVELLIKQRDGLISEADATRQINALKEMDVRNDFHKYWYKPSLNQQYSFNIKGGEENIRYYFSAGYDNNTSSLSNKYDRFTLSSSNSFYPLKGLEITAGLNYTLANNRYGRGDYTSVSSGTGVSLYPYAQLADEYGNPTAVLKDYRQVFKEESEQKGFLNWDYYPLQESNLTDNTSKLNDALFNTGLKYQFLKGLSVNLKYQYEQSSNEGRVLYNKNSYYTRNLINQYTQQTEAEEITRPIPEGDILNLSDGKTVSHSFRAQLDFNKDWNKHSLSAIAGYELKDLKNIQHTSNRYGYSDDVLTSIPVDYSGFYALSNYSYYLSATIPDNVSYMDRLTRFVSFFSNAAYTYDRRYTLSASARKDGSNLFGVNTNQKAVPLYSAGVAWEVSNERF